MPEAPAATPVLSSDEDVGAAPLPARLELEREVIGGAQPMDAGADDDVPGAIRYDHVQPFGGRLSHFSRFCRAIIAYTMLIFKRRRACHRGSLGLEGHGFMALGWSESGCPRHASWFAGGRRANGSKARPLLLTLPGRNAPSNRSGIDSSRRS